MDHISGLIAALVQCFRSGLKSNLFLMVIMPESLGT